MTSDNDHPLRQPTLSGVLRQDLRQGNFWGTLRREFTELREFSLDSEKRARLKTMGSIRRHIVVVWWILREMILKLTPHDDCCWWQGSFFYWPFDPRKGPSTRLRSLPASCSSCSSSFSS